MNLKEQFFEGIETLKQNFDKNYSLSNEKTGERILRSGDAFRLRSLKFPEYELGITNVKIRDNFSYLGLRKVGIH